MKGLAALLLLAVSAAPAAAHHGWSSYDSTKELTLTGTAGSPRFVIRDGGASTTSQTLR